MDYRNTNTNPNATMNPRGTRLFGGELGVKGLLRVVVDRPVYRAGELVTGSIFVSIREPIRCDTLSLSIVGEEIAQWMQSGDHHSQYHEFLKHEIVTAVLPDPLLPGEYMYPFEFQLQDDLPGVLDADSLFGTVDSLHATIKYTLRSRIRVQGRFVSDLETQFNLVVRSKEAPVSRTSAVERTVSKKVRALRVLNCGTCHLAAAMPKNTFTLAEIARVDCFVNNHTSRVGVREVRCALYQDVTLKLPSGETRRCTRQVTQIKCKGPRSGDMMERPLQLGLSGKARHPTTVGNFLRCEYRVRIECDLAFGSEISVDFPIIIVANDVGQPQHIMYSFPTGRREGNAIRQDRISQNHDPQIPLPSSARQRQHSGAAFDPTQSYQPL
ncbi:hypothetical protein Poli38472_008329 [Pythium oligandrum]|uniref:Arrestin C-terminal-like domain-containing protein n=1 Tax=Pythium oligandrum TaxID=41045 RepID=A0A8K1FNB0_PYTOL|nr:hypothetical protein Poli38472_008329 [Pythium oligandrum]|eukprot:TMW65687.1 hypothetical protein Poli38472_008329 [Pythium oligandrum]